jgi:hypothetical protein
VQETEKAPKSGIKKNEMENSSDIMEETSVTLIDGDVSIP